MSDTNQESLSKEDSLPSYPPPPYKPRDNDVYVAQPTRENHGISNNSENLASAHSPPQPQLPPQPTILAAEYVPVVIHQNQPLPLYCPYCNAYVQTYTSRSPGPVAFLSSALLCLMCWPLAWVPCVACQEERHICSICNRVLAIVD